MQTCFVTTCSSQKVGGGSPHFDIEAIRSRSLPKLLRARQILFRAVRSGQVEGDLRGANEGPDFGGNQSGLYLRAFDRYGAGSFVASLSRELGEATKAWLEENRLLFISGLYGLIESFEAVQNYNVKLENTLEYWKNELVTTAFLAALGRSEGKRLVIDCCASPHYSGLIDWARLEKEGYSVRHVVGHGFESRQIRSAAASVAANVDSKYERERILNGSIIRCVDADIRFVTSEEFNTPIREDFVGLKPQRIGVILMKPGDREEVRQRFGGGLFRYIDFEFIERGQGEAGLKRLQATGCGQCLYRIMDEGHAEMREGFGRDLQIEISRLGMDPVGFRNFSQLRIDVKIRHS